MSNKSPFLQGNFAPWRSEDKINNLEVIGKIPDDLNGVLLRNGPNPQFDPKGPYHWFEGDGMIHAIRLGGGQASYDNRWVRTPRFELENKAGKGLFSCDFTNTTAANDIKDCPNTTANTNIIQLNRKLLALNEGESPTSIQLSNLETIGQCDFNGQINRNLSAHPRYDFRLKEIMTYSYTNKDGKLIYYRLNRDNKLISQKEINWPYQVMVHDFVNTENYVIFPLFPCTLSMDNIQKVGSPFMWEGDELNTLFIITDKQGNEVTRIETDPAYVYHFGNAYEDGDNIIIDAMIGKCSGLMPDRHGNVPKREDSNTRLGRWTINIKTGKINLDYLDDRGAEFPRFDERFNGKPYRHLYAGGRPSAEDLFDRIMHYDLQTGDKVEHLFFDDVPSEPVFVLKSETEGDGYLLTVVYRSKEDRSDLVILDANNIADEPLAIVKIPHRIPYGFHGNFIAK